MKKKILVTGGTGYIGSHTVVALQESDYEVVIIDNLSNSNKSVLDNIEKITGKRPIFYKADLVNLEDVKQIFEKEQNINGIIHFAAYKAVGESVAEPLKYYQNNLLSLINLLNLMPKYNISNFVFSSSCTVYGQPKKLPVTENSPILSAESPYGNTKQISEEIIKDTITAKNPIKAIALRYFNPIGAHPSALIGELPLGKPNNLVPFVTQTAAKIREELTIFGKDYSTSDGTCIRDYIHVLDLANAHIKALEYLEKQSQNTFYDFFNIGTGQGNSVLEVVKTFEEVNNLKLNYKFGDRRDGDVEKVYADTKKANEVLDWKAKLNLAHALKDAWNWQKNISNLD